MLKEQSYLDKLVYLGPVVEFSESALASRSDEYKTFVLEGNLLYGKRRSELEKVIFKGTKIQLKKEIRERLGYK